MLHIIWSVAVGFIVGAIALWLMPTGNHYGFFMTALIGIAGSVVGGLIGRIFSKPADGAFFHPAGFFMSILGAVIVLFVVLKFLAPAA